MEGSSALTKNGRLYGSRLMESAISTDGNRRQLFISMVGDNRRLLLERQSSALEGPLAMGIIVGSYSVWDLSVRADLIFTDPYHRASSCSDRCASVCSQTQTGDNADDLRFYTLAEMGGTDRRRRLT